MSGSMAARWADRVRLAGDCGECLDCVDEAGEACGGGDGLFAGCDQAGGYLVAELAGLDRGGQFAGEHQYGQPDRGRAQVVAGLGGDGADGGRGQPW